MSTTQYDYDLVVIGGGSGGVSTAKRAASLYKKKVAVIEGGRWGGTCVNVGCVPKKIWFQAASVYEIVHHDSKHYRIGLQDGEHKITFDWRALKLKRDAYIQRLNDIYKNGLTGLDVTILEGWGSFIDAHTIHVAYGDGTVQTVTSDKVIIAVGGKPDLASSGSDGIMEHTITSDGFFELEEQPQKAIVVGAGYIAVELAGVLAALGTETHLVLRKEKALRNFDPDIADFLDNVMTNKTPNMHIHRNTGGVAKVEADPVTGKKIVTTVYNNEIIGGADIVLMAAGRVPNVDGLNLPSAGVTIDARTKYIVADEYQNTSVDNIYACGDVCGKVELTPMAIAAGRRLADRLFSNNPSLKYAKTSYENVPTVVFSVSLVSLFALFWYEIHSLTSATGSSSNLYSIQLLVQLG